jgi:adenine-specific DNA-methyltransferase
MNEYETVSKSVKIDIIDGLKDRLPQIFEDGKVNLEKLKVLLTGEIVEKEDDRSYFNWAGKSKLFKLIQEPGYGTLKPDKERSIDFDNTENIVIVGENLETLKLLLKPYFGKVKMIYIDPPYNTGKDFIYRDNFKEPLKDYLEKTGQIDSEGSKLTTNTEASGRYHSDWLNFMYPRLFLARSLLRDDGVIFVSIDDHEVHHLRKIMDEIFGEENFVGAFIWKNKTGGGGKQSSNIPGAKILKREAFVLDHEYILVFSKNISNLYRFNVRLSNEDIKGYSNPDNDPRGPYKLKSMEMVMPKPISTMYYELTDPDDKKIKPRGGRVQWRYSKERCLAGFKDGSVVWKKIKCDKSIDSRGYRYMPYTKQYLNIGGEQRTKIARSILYDIAYSSGGTREIMKLFNQARAEVPIFSNPKPAKLIKHLTQINTSESDIILDFFAGSGTTGHAVWDLNKEDGGKRKFILVNLDEEVLDENIKKEFPTVADICIERLKKVSEKDRKEEQQKLAENDQDFGFKVFRLDKSNFNLKDEFEIYEGADAEELKKKYLDWLSLWINEPLVGDWKPIDIVYEIMLKEGFDLNSKIEEMKIKRNKFFHVVDEKQELEFYMSLDEKITEEAIEEIRTPEYRDKVFVFLDKALTDNDKINLSAFVRLKVI